MLEVFSYLDMTHPGGGIFSSSLFVDVVWSTVVVVLVFGVETMSEVNFEIAIE